MQVFFTVVKILAIALLAGGLFFSGEGSFQNFITDSAILKPAGFALMAAIVAACNGALQAYDGWGNMIYVAGEIREPVKYSPKSHTWFVLYASPCLKKISRLRVLQ